MATTFAGFNQKLTLLGRALSGQELRGITTRVAGKSKPILTGGFQPNSLSNWGRGKKGSTMKARYDIQSDSVAMMSATPRALVALLEKGSGTTWKAPKRRGSPRRKKGSIGTYTRASVPARHAFTKGANVLDPKVPPMVHAEVSKVLGRLF